jgi:hypothetical protein
MPDFWKIAAPGEIPGDATGVALDPGKEARFLRNVPPPAYPFHDLPEPGLVAQLVRARA